MDVILHIGAHRTATTSFVHYMLTNTTRLEQKAVGFWGPLRSQGGVLADAPPFETPATPDEQFDAAQERVLENLDRAEARGIEYLLISDENIIGSPARNFQDRRLYGGIGERMARFSQVFAGRLTKIVLTIRSQDTYWNSVAAVSVAHGHEVPDEKNLGELASSQRQWRDVLTDLACAVPDVEIQVHPYEVFGGMPERRLAAMTGEGDWPSQHAREWLNRAPGLSELREIVRERGEDPGILSTGEGRWHPFNRDQVMALREAYADDLFWLRAGADDLATLIEETGSAKAGKQPQADDATRGQTDGKEDRRLPSSGRERASGTSA